MNAVQHLGKAVGLTVLGVDAGKGILAVVIAQQMSVTDTWVYVSAFAVTMGHNFTPALKFKGGKGAATVLGISAFMLWQLTAISAAFGLVILVIFRHPVWAVTGRICRAERFDHRHRPAGRSDSALPGAVVPSGRDAHRTPVRGGVGGDKVARLAQVHEDSVVWVVSEKAGPWLGGASDGVSALRQRNIDTLCSKCLALLSEGLMYRAAWYSRLS